MKPYLKGFSNSVKNDALINIDIYQELIFKYFSVHVFRFMPLKGFD